jgi:hypothetical protein
MTPFIRHIIFASIVGFSLIILLFFIVLSLIHRKRINEVLLFKNEYNSLKYFTIYNNFKYIKKLGENNENINKKYLQLIRMKKNMDNMLILLKKKLIFLTFSTNNFFYHTILHVFSETRDEIELLKKYKDEMCYVVESVNKY